MKSMVKILVRYIISAASVALILLVINVTVLAIWTIRSNEMQDKYHISEFSECLVKENDRYVLTQSGKKVLEGKYEWAMLLNDKGNVIWSEKLPDNIPLNYTVSDIASITRWYLNDYPVNVWKHTDGLLVLGSPRGSIWKINAEMPQRVMDYTLAGMPVVLILNVIAAVLLALLFGLRLFWALRPIAAGIEDISENKPVKLPVNGLLGNLAVKLNQTSAQLEAQTTALKQRDSARTTWIAGVSHDIRTPLSMVMGYSSQLEENGALPKEQREQAGIIRRQSEKIKVLVSNLNLASKLEYDMQPIHVKAVYPAAILRSVVSDFLNSGIDKRYYINLCIQKDAQSIVIEGDDELLTRAAANLITNSIAHNPGGCSIKVMLEKTDTYCLLTMSDNGIGFSKDVLNRINNPENTNELNSHGLGLTIVCQIVKVHGGHTEFSNLPGEGCEVTIKLPLT